jgi:hypothetical protein
MQASRRVLCSCVGAEDTKHATCYDSLSYGLAIETRHVSRVENLPRAAEAPCSELDLGWVFSKMLIRTF